MDKQNEVLMEAYRSMLHELQKLQVVIFSPNHSILSLGIGFCSLTVLDVYILPYYTLPIKDTTILCSANKDNNKCG